MSRDLKIYKQLQAYIQDKLAEDEKVALESQMQSPEVRDWLRVHGAIEAAGDQYYTELFQSLHTEMKLKEKRRRTLIWTSIAAAAVISMFLLIRGNFFPNSNTSSEVLFAEHFEKPASIDRSEELHGKAPNEVIKTLKQKEQLEALDYRSLGFAYFEKEEYEQAISAFAGIGYKSYLKDEALWYQALAALKVKKIKEAQSYLLELIEQDQNQNSSFRPKAVRLQKQLQNL